MKNIMRAFAFSLVLAGAVASTHSANTTAQTIVVAKVSAMPVPACPPDDPNACGMAAYRGK